MENSDKWTDAEVQALLNIYAAKEIQRDFEGTKRNMRIFPCISAQLAALGIHHTAKQCREKIKKLKQDYKKIKDHNNQSGSERKTSKWYLLLDSILGHRQPYVGNAETKVSALVETHHAAAASSTLSTEAIAEEITPQSSLKAETNITADDDILNPCAIPCIPNHLTASSTPSRPSCPSPVRLGKRKRGDNNMTVLTLVKEMMEQEEEDRRQSHVQMQSLVDMLKEQAQREVEEQERLRAEMAEARRQQAAFMEGLLTTMNRLVAGTQGLRHPDVD